MYGDHTNWSGGLSLIQQVKASEAECARLKQQLEQAQARVAQLESHFSKRPNVHDHDLRVEYARWADELEQVQ